MKPDVRVWETIESWFPTIARSEFVMVGDREGDDLAVPRKRGWGAIQAAEMDSLIDGGAYRPTTMIMDAAHHIPDDKLRALGINPLRIDVLSNALAKWEGWRELDPSKTVVVASGNGAMGVVSSLFPSLPSSWSSRLVRITAKRIWEPGSEPWAIASPIFPNRMVLGIHDVVLIDDVIASGATVRKVHELNQPWIPGARWHALTWLAQRSASIPGEVKLVAATRCGNFLKREPIVSASTLVNNPEILRSFARKNSPGLVELFSSL